MSYFINGNKVEGEYFHLDKDLNVIGHLSMAQMMSITTKLLENNELFKEVLDSLDN